MHAQVSAAHNTVLLNRTTTSNGGGIHLVVVHCGPLRLFTSESSDVVGEAKMAEIFSVYPQASGFPR